MKIEINIEKKHMYYLMFLIIFFFVGGTLAGFDPSIAAHEILYTNTID